MTTHHINIKTRRVVLASCVCVTALLSASVAHGAVSVTASRDYVDKKFIAATNAADKAVSALSVSKQDALTVAQTNAVNSGITSSKVNAYDDFVSKSYLQLSGGTRYLSDDLKMASGKKLYFGNNTSNFPFWMYYTSPYFYITHANGSYVFPTNKSGTVAVEDDIKVSSVNTKTGAVSLTLNDICPETENWLGVQGNAGRHIKILAGTSGGSIVGGVRITNSTQNDENITTYAYNGVAVRRNNANTDFLWSTEHTNGVVRRQELGYYVTKSELIELVTAIVTNLYGNVYWNSSDGGKTMDAYWRDGEEVSNIVQQVNAYLEDGHASVYSDSSNAPQTDDENNVQED